MLSIVNHAKHGKPYQTCQNTVGTWQHTCFRPGPGMEHPAGGGPGGAPPPGAPFGRAGSEPQRVDCGGCGSSMIMAVILDNSKFLNSKF